MPIEIMAARGADTMRFGPLRPVGLVDPNTGHRPWANVQLRAENKERTLYNIVGFQTNLKLGRAEAGVQHDPGPGKCRVRAVRCHAPQHLPGCAPCAGRGPVPGRSTPMCSLRARSPALRAIWRAPPAACWQPGASTPGWRAGSCPAAGGYHVRRADPVSDH